MVGFLEGIGDLSLNVSLNSASPRGRRLLMGDGAERAERAIEGVRLLGRSTVPYSGSLVALPNLVGWDDVRETVLFLAANNATAVRVVAPAFSWLADPGAARRDQGPLRGAAAVRGGSAGHSAVPGAARAFLRPSDLTPVVSGVLAGSPARRGGGAPGRRVRDDQRTEAALPGGGLAVAPAGRAGVGGDPAGRRRADGGVGQPAEGEAGVTMEYDFDPARSERLAEAIVAAGAGAGRSFSPRNLATQ